MYMLGNSPLFFTAFDFKFGSIAVDSEILLAVSRKVSDAIHHVFSSTNETIKWSVHS